MVCKLGDRGHMMHTYANKLEVVSQIQLKRYSSTHLSSISQSHFHSKENVDRGFNY